MRRVPCRVNNVPRSTSGAVSPAYQLRVAEPPRSSVARLRRRRTPAACAARPATLATLPPWQASAARQVACPGWLRSGAVAPLNVHLPLEDSLFVIARPICRTQGRAACAGPEARRRPWPTKSRRRGTSMAVRPTVCRVACSRSRRPTCRAAATAAGERCQ